MRPDHDHDHDHDHGPGSRSLRTAQTVVDRVVGRALPVVVRWFARDITRSLGAARILVLSPHPDDETLACGATITRVLDGGGTAVVVIATDGSLGVPSTPPEVMAATRREEVAAASRRLGVVPGNLVALALPDATLTENEDRLTMLVDAVVDEHRPDTVFSPSVLDIHPDHAALGRAARRVLDGRPVRHLEYLVWGWQQPSRLVARHLRQGRTGRGRPRRPVRVRTDGYRGTKARALACYQSQFAPGTELFGVPLGGTGPLDERFLQPFDRSSEVFFPR